MNTKFYVICLQGDEAPCTAIVELTDTEKEALIKIDKAFQKPVEWGSYCPDIEINLNGFDTYEEAKNSIH